MEDSSFAGWTTPPGVMDMPTGRRLDRPPREDWIGEVRSQPHADYETIKYASRSWPQGRAGSFDRSGRVWTERATGIVYKLVRGNRSRAWGWTATPRWPTCSSSRTR